MKRKERKERKERKQYVRENGNKRGEGITESEAECRRKCIG